MKPNKTNAILFLTIAVALISFLGYVVVNGLPWFGGKYILNAKDAIKYGLDLRGGVTITYMPEGNYVPNQEQLNSVKSIMRSRLDAKGYLDANVTTSQSNRVIVEIPNLKDPQAAVKELGQTALLELIDTQGQQVSEGQFFTGGQVILSGTEVTKATAEPAQSGSNWIINFEMSPEGQKKFAEATGRIAGTPNGAIAIALDKFVISAPSVSKKIDTNSAMIEGPNITQDYAINLANLISSGALPFKLKDVSSQYVGASLGQNALNISIMAGIIGFLIVVLFMISWYRVPGLAASIALVGYIGTVLFIMARPNLFTGSKITLTLPGIAGIILSIGVAVDANVIIFERIKEELRSGKSLRAAIDAGFKRGWPAIRDANFTTIISSLVLFFLGTGPIKGFALTLIIGVLVSMISAILVTRFILNQFYNMGITKPSLYGVKEGKA